MTEIDRKSKREREGESETLSFGLWVMRKSIRLEALALIKETWS